MKNKIKKNNIEEIIELAYKLKIDNYKVYLAIKECIYNIKKQSI